MTFLRTLAAAGLLVSGAAASAQAATVTIVCGSLPASLELCRSGSEAWAQARGHEVRVLAYPESTTRARDLVRELLEAGVQDLDVLEIDIVWPGLLAPHLVDLGPGLGEAARAFFRPAREGFSVEGRLLAAPWYVSVGRLFYRTDLLARYGLQVPRTWEELAASARQIQEGERAAGRSEFWGYVWQGRVGEGLTANAVEWLASRGLPPILMASGEVAVDRPEAAVVLGLGRSWIDSVSPGAVLDMGGSQSLELFTAGNAAFLRYWSNGLQLAEAGDSAVRGRVGMAELPAGDEPGGRRATVLGGFGLAVSRHSQHQELAIDLVRWLTSPDEQKRRALAGPFDPSLPRLYEDEELVAARPHFPALRPAIDAATLRPAVIARDAYDSVSQTFAEGVRAILLGEREPGPGLAALAAALRRLNPGSQRWGS